MSSYVCSLVLRVHSTLHGFLFTLPIFLIALVGLSFFVLILPLITPTRLVYGHSRLRREDNYNR